MSLLGVGYYELVKFVMFSRKMHTIVIGIYYFLVSISAVFLVFYLYLLLYVIFFICSVLFIYIYIYIDR